MSRRKQRISELPPQLVDYLIAQIEGIPYLRCQDDMLYRIYDAPAICQETQSGRMFPYAPSVDWRAGGPLITKHEVALRKSGELWDATHGGLYTAYGETPLLAAMRLIVMMRLGPEVEIDDDLPT
jgi:hypothetical protein